VEDNFILQHFPPSDWYYNAWASFTYSGESPTKSEDPHDHNTKLFKDRCN